MEAAQHMESFYAMNLSYTGAADTSGNLNHFSADTDFNSYYTLAASGVSGSAYTLTATAKPNGGQAGDSCSPMSINSQGLTTPSSGGCW
ncbi:type IV pilin protein [Agarivorans sp. TSD2052]|nr:type IV pilin protein [Agarivorans sp. TSD2052]